MNNHNVLAVVLFLLRCTPLHCFQTSETYQKPNGDHSTNELESFRNSEFVIVNVNVSLNDDENLMTYINQESSQIVRVPYHQNILKGDPIQTCSPQTEFRFFKSSETSRWTRVRGQQISDKISVRLAEQRIPRESSARRRDSQIRLCRRRSETSEYRIKPMEEKEESRRHENMRIRSFKRSSSETSRRETLARFSSRRERIQTSTRNLKSMDTRSQRIGSNRIGESRTAFRRGVLIENERQNTARGSRNDLVVRRVNDKNLHADVESQMYDSRRNIAQEGRELNSSPGRRFVSSETTARRIASLSEERSDERLSNSERNQNRESRHSRRLINRRYDESRIATVSNKDFDALKDERRLNEDFLRSDNSQTGCFLIKISFSVLVLLLMRGDGKTKSFDFTNVNSFFKCIL